jgi:hypothetical protein
MLVKLTHLGHTPNNTAAPQNTLDSIQTLLGTFA